MEQKECEQSSNVLKINFILIRNEVDGACLKVVAKVDKKNFIVVVVIAFCSIPKKEEPSIIARNSPVKLLISGSNMFFINLSKCVYNRINNMHMLINVHYKYMTICMRMCVDNCFCAFFYSMRACVSRFYAHLL